MKKKKSLIWVALAFMGLSSCKLFYPNQMFKQKDYQYFEFAQKQVDEYLIEPGDLLNLHVYSRDGFKLVDVLGGSESNEVGTTSENVILANTTNYLVDKEGFAKLPILGDYYVKGYSHHQLENELAQKYSSLFVNPFVLVKVVNRRVFVFKGSLGGAVVDLNSAPTSLIEVLAKAGGLEKGLKAYKIKVIRGDMKNPEVRLIDLSTLEGLRSADLMMQPNDIVYVEDRKRVVRDALTETLPFFTGLTTLISFILLIKSLGK
jgi:polysaccharide export outer membrane protein